MGRFLYCLNASTIKPQPILRQIEVAAEAGYSAIELWHDDIDTHVASGGQVVDVRKALDDNGLDVATTIFLKGWWDTTGAVYERAMDENKRRLEQAATIGAPHTISGPPLGLVNLDQGAEQYARLLEVGRQFGVRPVFEYLGFAAEVNTVEVAIRVMTQSGDADATVVLDSFHCFRGGGGFDAIAQLEERQIAICHVNDAPAFPPRQLQQDPDRVMPGDGVIDLDCYWARLREIGYERYMSLELFNRQYWAQDPLETAREGLRKMQCLAER